MKNKCSKCNKPLGHGNTALIEEDREVKKVCIECQRKFEHQRRLRRA